MFHTHWEPFGPQPIVDGGKWPEWPNPPIWPKPLWGRSLRWRLSHRSADGGEWEIDDGQEHGYRFKVGGDRVFAERGTTLEALGTEGLARLVVAAIGRQFIGPDHAELGVERPVAITLEDFATAAV
jgi:hypothetical protein